MEITPLKILLVEDDEEDYFLLKSMLSKIKNFSYVLDWTPLYEKGVELLLLQVHDIYLVDYRLGANTGLDFLDEAKKFGVDKPVIVLTGLLGEDLGTQAIRKGAEDYLEKGRIAPELLQRSIHYSLERWSARGREQALVEEQAILLAMQQSEARFRALIENTYDVVVLSDREGNHSYATPSIERLVGYTPHEFMNIDAFTIIHADDIALWREKLIALRDTPRDILQIELRLRHKHGHWLWFETTITNLLAEPYINSIVTTYHDISERKRLERQKDDFVSIATHELKTPVTSIKAYTQMMHHMFLKQGDTHSASYLYKMNLQLDKLTNLIADLLDITKIEGGKLPLQKDYFQLQPMVTDIVEVMQRTTDKHSLILHSSENISVWGDQDRIGQVLTNLISKAIKYSPGATRVDITATCDTNNVIFKVQDYGIGIPSEAHNKVFEKFFRVTHEKRETFPGLGLGLYLSADIVIRHHGKMWFESEEGSGSSFYFSIPLYKQNQ